MTSPKPIQPLFWKAVIPTAVVLLFTLGCLVARDLMAFQLATLYSLAYASLVFTVGAIYYRPRAKSNEEAIPEDELPFVSILIPAHNEENVIGHTISHMLRLDYPRFEVIVIDDHSSDRTSEIVRTYPVGVCIRPSCLTSAMSSPWPQCSTARPSLKRISSKPKRSTFLLVAGLPMNWPLLVPVMW